MVILHFSKNYLLYNLTKGIAVCLPNLLLDNYMIFLINLKYLKGAYFNGRSIHEGDVTTALALLKARKLLIP